MGVTPSWQMESNAEVGDRYLAAQKVPEKNNRQTDRQMDTQTHRRSVHYMMIHYHHTAENTTLRLRPHIFENFMKL